MNTNVWYLPYFEGVYYTRMMEAFSNARMVRVVYTMYNVCMYVCMYVCRYVCVEA